MLRLIDRFHDLPALVTERQGRRARLERDVLGAARRLVRAAARSGATSRGSGSCPTRPTRRAARSAARPEERAATAVQTVANLRSVAGRYPDDPGLARLLDELHAGSAEFRELWADADAGGWRSHTKTVAHPTLGRADARVRHPARPRRRPEPDRLLGGARVTRGRGARAAPGGRHPGPQHGPVSSRSRRRAAAAVGRRSGSVRVNESHRVSSGEGPAIARRATSPAA